MCGIAGHFAWRQGAPPVDREALGRTCAALAARGPDGEGVWLGPRSRVGLAHRRLAIIDPSPAGAQPMSLDGGRLVIVFNGEIYNFRRLRRELEAAGRRFRTASDTEVLLHLYDREGAAMVERLRGMFALAIWDEARRGLFLARDGFGIKPLYYANSGGVFRFASQVKALLAGGGIDRSPSAPGRAGFFVWGSVPEPWTVFRDIRCFPAGCSLWVDGNGARAPAVHFDLAAVLAEAEQAPTAEADPEALRDAVRDTVRRHLVADVPVGAFLSAGQDSATIAAHAAAVSPDAVQAVTLAFPEFKGDTRDEAPLAREVAERYGLQHQVRSVSRDDFRAARESLLQAMDQPSIDGVNTWFVSRAAASMGLKTALSGLGGDELFAGYRGFTDIPRAVRLFGPLGRVGRLAGAVGRRLTAPMLGSLASPKVASLLEYGTNHADAYLLSRALLLPWELPAVMDPEQAREGWGEVDALRREQPCLDGLRTPRARVTALELSWYLRNQLLRDSDWAGMAHGVEIRTPLVDTVFFRRLAPWLVARQPPGKRELALTPPAPLPAAVLNRSKTGFEVPMRPWLSSPGEPAAARAMRHWARVVVAGCYP